jgi:hypothetical protein
VVSDLQQSLHRVSISLGSRLLCSVEAAAAVRQTVALFRARVLLGCVSEPTPCGVLLQTLPSPEPKTRSLPVSPSSPLLAKVIQSPSGAVTVSSSSGTQAVDAAVTPAPAQSIGGYGGREAASGASVGFTEVSVRPVLSSVLCATDAVHALRRRVMSRPRVRACVHCAVWLRAIVKPWPH